MSWAALPCAGLHFLNVLILSPAYAGFSASYHTLMAHSERVAIQWNRLDYVGIVVLISGTFVPLVHYGFYCDPHLRNTYIALIYTFALGERSPPLPLWLVWAMMRQAAGCPPFRSDFRLTVLDSKQQRPRPSSRRTPAHPSTAASELGFSSRSVLAQSFPLGTPLSAME